MVNKASFWGQIFEMEIFMELNVLKFPESEIVFLWAGLSFSLSTHVCIRGLHGQDFSGPVRMAVISARPEVKKKLWPGSGPAEQKEHQLEIIFSSIARLFSVLHKNYQL